VVGFYEHIIETLSSIKGREFLEQLGGLLNEDTDPRSWWVRMCTYAHENSINLKVITNLNFNMNNLLLYSNIPLLLACFWE
jgi:hypothetical protein